MEKYQNYKEKYVCKNNEECLGCKEYAKTKHGVATKDKFIKSSLPRVGRILNKPFKNGTEFHDIQMANWIIFRLGGELKYVEVAVGVKTPDFFMEW
jgi:hypothetical protein